MKDMNTLVVSVIIPTYNNANYVKKAIDSALNQTVKTEVIVIDDHSTDCTKDTIEQYIQDEKIVYRYNEKNLGVAESRNKGVQVATGDYIAFLDADDWWDKEKLSLQLKFMQEHGYQMSGTSRIIVNEDGSSTDQVIHIGQQITYEKLLRHNSISCSSVVIERKLALEFPMKHSEVHEDYLTWLSMLEKCKIAGGLDEPLLYYRLTKSGKSRNKIKSMQMTYGVYRILGFKRLKSFSYLISHLIHGVFKYWIIKD